MSERQYGRDDVDYSTWYSAWSKMLARTMTRQELERRLGRNRTAAVKATRSHLAAVERSTSMTSRSGARAQTRNVVAAVGDEMIAISGALEIHDLFPEFAKGAGVAE